MEGVSAKKSSREKSRSNSGRFEGGLLVGGLDILVDGWLAGWWRFEIIDGVLGWRVGLWLWLEKGNGRDGVGWSGLD